MKSQRLFVSLFCLAVCLLAANVYVRWPGRSPNLQSHLETSPSGGAQTQPPNQDEVAPISGSGLLASFSWRELESADYHQYIANLRSIGCPEQTIRDIIIADVNKIYAAREKSLKAAPKPKPDNPIAETADQRMERLRKLRTLQLEKRAVLKDLLGVDIPLDLLPSSGSRDYQAFEVALNFLSADKRDAVQSLQEKYWQDADDLTAKYGSKRTPQFTAESRQLKDSLRQELAKILTPAELEDYDMRTSPAAKQLSTSLATYFHPTEDEFRQIFRAQTAYQDAIVNLSATTQLAPPADPADPAAVAQQRAAQRQALNQARADARTQMNDQVKKALGDDRYAEYQRSQDRTFDLLSRLGLRYNLPQETVLQAYDLQKSFASGNGAPTDAAARADRQQQLNDQLTTILGEQPARAYRRVQGGTVPVN